MTTPRYLAPQNSTAVVFVQGEGAAFEVEFVAESGQAVAVVTLDRADVRPLKAAEVTLTRALSV